MKPFGSVNIIKNTLRNRIIQKQKHCAISRYSNPFEIQVAHIIPRYMNNKILYDTNTEINCWLLGNGLHSLFDSFHWTVDIFSFLDFNIESDSHFKSFLVIKKQGFCESQLYLYKNTVFDIPIQYFPSLYAHYYTYLMTNYTLTKQYDSWNHIVNSEIFNRLTLMSSTSEIKQFLLEKRKEHWKDRDQNLNEDCTIAIDYKLNSGKINVVWDYYKFMDNTCEPLENVPEELLSQYVDFKDNQTDKNFTQ